MNKAPADHRAHCRHSRIIIDLQANTNWSEDITINTGGIVIRGEGSQATGGTTITMTATPALDLNDVEYYSTCTAGGAADSGWQSSNSYSSVDDTFISSWSANENTR